MDQKIVDGIHSSYANLTPAQSLAQDKDVLKMYLQSPPELEEELYHFLVALTHEPMPWEKSCADHATPWDYIWQSYRVDLPEWRDTASRHLIYVGPRGGYKTLSVAKLIAAELLLKPGCSTVGMGAIENHAKRTYQFVQRYLNHRVLAEMRVAPTMTMAETVLWNGSIYKQVCATWAGVNSQHPHKLRTEENDLITDPAILEEAKMMPSTHNNIRAHMSYVSSRKFEDGIMDQLVQNAQAKGYDVLVSCYKDSAEQCPPARRGPQATKPYVVEDLENVGQTIVLAPEKTFVNCETCPILPSCQGDLAHAKGVVSIEDIISDWRILDRDTWMWQKECKRTRSGNSYFVFWHEDLNEGKFPYRPDWGPVDLSFDFTGGGDDPTAVGFWQTHDDNDYMFGELVFDGDKLADHVSDEVYDFVVKTKITQLGHMFGDSAAQSWIKEMNSKSPRGKERFFRIKPVRKVENREAWPLMGGRVRDNSGWRHLFVDKSCTLFRHEVKNAKKSRNDPKDISKTCSNHSLDQCKYRLVELRYHGQKQPNIRILGDSYAEEPDEIRQERSKKEEVADSLPRYLYGGDDDD